ncbi:MAG: DNA-binding protein WhiA [Oscillospiraceae bacterium]|nr:DNA-binding protein WhiA [Oscillospiraceae bacterium]
MSYSNKVKEIIAEKARETDVNKCCAGIKTNDGDFLCGNCAKAFFRELFLSSGNISDPKDAYHLEFAISDKETAEKIKNILDRENIFLKYIKRRNKHILYLKSSEQIEDFLYYIDIPKVSFDLMETKILKDVRNNANRVTNFEHANLGKISEASARQIEAINLIIEKGAFDSLSAELKQTSRLRLENIEMSIEEIGRISEPPVSKSGIKHRMKKIINTAEELRR